VRYEGLGMHQKHIPDWMQVGEEKKKLWMSYLVN